MLDRGAETGEKLGIGETPLKRVHLGISVRNGCDNNFKI